MPTDMNPEPQTKISAKYIRYFIDQAARPWLKATLEQLMRRKSLTNGTLAQRLGWSRSAVTRRLNMKSAKMEWDEITSICVVMGYVPKIVLVPLVEVEKPTVSDDVVPPEPVTQENISENSENTLD